MGPSPALSEESSGHDTSHLSSPGAVQRMVWPPPLGVSLVQCQGCGLGVVCSAARLCYLDVKEMKES